jgi:hypothetical protein
MGLREFTVVALLLVTACDERRTGEAPQGATVQLASADPGGAAATLDIQETREGLTIAVTQGDVGKDGVAMRIASECPQPQAAAPAAGSGPPPTPEAPPSVAPDLGAPPQLEDRGTQAATKGERAESSRVTADESGQAADRMLPTTATPEQRQVELTPTAGGFTAPELTVEEILGRAIVLEGPSGTLCGRAQPPAPAPAG